jgi:DNA-directed RNA polymerase beta subunit
MAYNSRMTASKKDIQMVFTTAESKREDIRAKVTQALQEVFPFKGNRYTLEVKDVEVDPVELSPDEHKKAILQARTISEPVRGTLILKDTVTGNILETREHSTLAQIPYLTPMQSFVINGIPYTVNNQLRVKPGVYTRKRKNEVLEAAFNLAKGSNFRLSMDQEKGLFNMEYGTTKIPLYPVLQKLGVSDAKISKAWNPDLARINREEYQGKADKHIDRLYDRMVYDPTPATNSEDRLQRIKEEYALTVMDPKVNQRTLGKPYGKVTPEALLEASSKLLRVYQNPEDLDERESMAFKQLKSVDDFFAERIKLDARDLRRKLLTKLERGSGKLEDLPSSPFTKGIRTFLTTSSLKDAPTQINPVEMIDSASKVTLFGEGGIGDIYAVPAEARRLHLSQIGVIDPVRTPDTMKAGVDLRTTLFTARDREGNIYTLLRDAKTGKNKFVPVEEAADAVVGFPNQGKSGMLDAIEKSQIRSVPAGRINYYIPVTQAMYSPSTNLIPLQESVDGNRQMMASKMMTQALPLLYREAPLVQVKSYAGSRFKTMEEEIAARAAPRSPYAGTVQKIKDGYIYIKPESGKYAELDEIQGRFDGDMVKIAADSARVSYYQNFPLASKTYLDNPLLVKQGDRVRSGQQLTDSPFIKDGTLALGTNLTTAYMSYRGANSNDAIVISEGAAQKLTSAHMYKVGEDISGDMEVDRTKHQSYFGNKYTAEQYANLDEGGVAKPGAKVRKGDLLIATLQKAQVSPEAEMLGRLHKSLVKPYRDASTIWEKDYEGTIVDVMKHGNKIRITIRMDEPMVVGSKLCYTEDTEVLTKRGWKPVAEVTLEDECYTVTADGKIELHYPRELHQYPSAGVLYCLKSQQVDLRVTPGHNLFVQMRNSDKYELIPAERAIGKRCRHRKNGDWERSTPLVYSLPTIDYAVNGKGCHMQEKCADRFSATPMRPWLVFLGAYIANGSTTIHNRTDRPGETMYRVELHTRSDQTHSVSGNQHGWLKKVLDECGFPYTERDDRLSIHSKQLALFLKPLGHAAEKRVPREVFEWGKDAAEWILEGLIGCDGHKTNSGSIGYTTISKQLSDDFQQLALHAGFAANSFPQRPANEKWSLRYSIRLIKARCNPHVNLRPKAQKVYKEKEEIIASDEPVYGITIPNHTLYVQVNGKPVWSGNSGRFGDKGVVSTIVPDDQMIKDETGRPIDILLSPASVVSRLNPSQILETGLAKVAVKTGKPIAVENFSGKNNVEWVKGLMKEHGVKDAETVFDPVTGKSIPNVIVGPRYFLKLFKTTETNYSARGVEDYDINQQPSRGGAAGAKSMGRLTFNALLAHNARGLLKESAVLKSQKNDEFWRAYQLGLPLPAFKTTFAYDKFGAMLAGAGIKMNKSDNFVSLGPLTDHDIDQVTSGAVQNSLIVRAKDLKPEQGGLFDPNLTGGTAGTKWSHVKLNEPVVNPIFERPARTLLGMTQKEFDETLRNEGGGGLRKRLALIDPKQRQKEVLGRIDSLKGNERDNAVKEIKYLKTLIDNRIRPDEAYTLSKVPVIPPMFRPVVPGRKGDLLVSDANYLYRDVMLANDAVASSRSLPSDIQGDARTHLQNSVAALFGTREPLSPQLQNKGVRGFIDRIAGTGAGPKYGYFQEKLVSRKQDLSGRGTIVPDQTLGMDEIGIPEDALWDMYRPFVMKGLVLRGYQAMDAKKMIDDQVPLAHEVLMNETKDRPVLYNRAPALYRYNVLAAYPKAVPGKTIRVHEMQAPIQSGDFDGDAVTLYAPVTNEAVNDARKMVLSNMLISDQMKHSLTKAAPHQEAVSGIYLASSAKPTGAIHKFETKADAQAAYMRGEISLNTPVDIKRI